MSGVGWSDLLCRFERDLDHVLRGVGVRVRDQEVHGKEVRKMAEDYKPNYGPKDLGGHPIDPPPSSPENPENDED